MGYDAKYQMEKSQFLSENNLTLSEIKKRIQGVFDKYPTSLMKAQIAKEIDQELKIKEDEYISNKSAIMTK